MNEAEHADAEAELRELCAVQKWPEAATLILRRYGSELLSYVVTIARNETDGSEAFAQFTEDLWRGLPRFRWHCAPRTWCYTLVRNALFRMRRNVRRRGGTAIALSNAPGVAQAARQVRSATLTYLRTQVKDDLADLREQLTADDQAILILRVDRKLPWLDVARALAGEEDLDGAQLVRLSATLRKRFGRIKADLRKLLEQRRAEREAR